MHQAWCPYHAVADCWRCCGLWLQVPAQQAVLPALEAMIRLQQELAPPMPQQSHRSNVHPIQLAQDAHHFPTFSRSVDSDGAHPVSQHSPKCNPTCTGLSARGCQAETEPTGTPRSTSHLTNTAAEYGMQFPACQARPTARPDVSSFNPALPHTFVALKGPQSAGVFVAAAHETYGGLMYEKQHLKPLLAIPPGCPPSVAATLRRKLGVGL